MIIGDCPYEECGVPHMVPIAPKCPAFSKETCEGCGREYWILHSRILPEALTLEAFAMKYTVDEGTKQISTKVL